MIDAEAERAAKEIKTLKIEFLTRAHDKAAAYTNIILGAGYAGAFAVWGITREHLPPEATIWIAILLSASLIGFVVFEVGHMVFRATLSLKQRDLITRKLDPRSFLDLHEQYARDADLALIRYIMPIWYVVMVWCVLTGLGAGFLLFYNFVAFLFGLPGWPN